MVSMTLRREIILVIVLTIAALCNAACYPANLNLVNWSSNAAWMKKGVNVTIPAGTNVLLDVSPPQLSSIKVYGGLYVNNANINVSTQFINVFADGSFVVGTSSCPITAKVIFTFYGPRQPNKQADMGEDPFDKQSLGSKGVAIQSNATFIAYGAFNGRGWTNLKQTAVKGSTMIYLRQSVSWKAGDEIIITSTDFSRSNPNYVDASVSWQYFKSDIAEPEQTEKLVIKAIDSSGTIISLTSPLNYTHWGADYQYAEVGSLTRNIVFTGDESSVASEYGMQVMMRKARAITIYGAEFTRGGQRGVLGRYPVHFHFIHDAANMGYVIRRSTSHNHFQRCLTVHETSGVTIDDFVAYNTIGHMIFLENGGELNNIFNRILAAATVPVGDTESAHGLSPIQLIPSDHFASPFWITNPANTFTDCVAVGGAFGFWYALPVAVLTTQSQAFHPPGYSPTQEHLQIFSNNTAHSNALTGVFMGVGPNPDGTDGGTSYNGNTGTFWNTIVYKNRDFGVWPFNNVHQRNATYVDNGVFGLFFRFNRLADNSLFMNWSPNTGISATGQKTLQSASGISTYDSNWGSMVANCVFINYNQTRIGYGGGAMHAKGSQVRPVQSFMNNTYINTNPVDNWGMSYTKAGTLVGTGTYVWNDCDGQVTGFKHGGHIVSLGSNITLPSPLGQCKLDMAIPGYKCPFTHNGYYQFIISDLTMQASINAINYTMRDGSFKSVWNNAQTFSRTRDATNPSLILEMAQYMLNQGCRIITPWCPYSVVAGTKTNMPARRIMSHKFVLGDQYRPSPNTMWVGGASMGVGEWSIISFPYPTNAKFVVSYYTSGDILPLATSYAALNGSNYWYDSNTELLWVLYYAAPQYIIGLNQSETHGFTPGAPDGIIINATCPGSLGLCNPTLSKLAITYPPPQTALPNVLNRIAKYTGTFANCLVETSPKPTGGSASVEISYSPDWGTIGVSLLHDLSNYAPTVIFGSQKGPGQKITWLTPTYIATSPSRWGYPNDPAFLSALYAGTLFIQINTNKYPNGHIRANIACATKGACPMPRLAVESSPCKEPAGSLRIWPNNTANAAFTVQLSATDSSALAGNPLMIVTNDYQSCGEASAFLTLKQNDRINFNFVNARTQPIIISSTTYQYLELYVQAPASAGATATGTTKGPGSAGFIDLNPQVYVTYATSTGNVWSQSIAMLRYAVNKVLNNDSGFQLVQIPLSAFGVPGTEWKLAAVTLFGGYTPMLRLNNPGDSPGWSAQPYIFSRMRLTGSKTALTTVSLAAPATATASSCVGESALASSADTQSSADVQNSNSPADDPEHSSNAPADSSEPTSAPTPSPAATTGADGGNNANHDNAAGTSSSKSSSSNKLPIIIGSVVAGLVVVAAVAAVAVMKLRATQRESKANPLYSSQY